MGKGRQLAGIMLENTLHGRRKHVWISVGNDLALDARRDLDDLGCGNPYSDLESDSSETDSDSEGEEEQEQEPEDVDQASNLSDNTMSDDEMRRVRRKVRKESNCVAGTGGESTEGSQARVDECSGERSGEGGVKEEQEEARSCTGPGLKDKSGGETAAEAEPEDVTVAGGAKGEPVPDSVSLEDANMETGGDEEGEQERGGGGRGASEPERPKKRRRKRQRESAGESVNGRGVFIDSFQQNKYAYGAIQEGDGVMFLTYSSLVAANRDGKSRLNQVIPSRVHLG